MKVKSESEVTQLCLTLSNPMDCSPPGSPVHGIFQARVLEWGAIAFSGQTFIWPQMSVVLKLRNPCSKPCWGEGPTSRQCPYNVGSEREEVQEWGKKVPNVSLEGAEASMAPQCCAQSSLKQKCRLMHPDVSYFAG